MAATCYGVKAPSPRSIQFILLLCAAWFGLQQILTVFYANGYFHLSSSLGFSDTSISLILLAIPAAGMVVQPYIGALSDRCLHPWGRRRPFIILGTVILIYAMLSFAWAEELMAIFSEAFLGTLVGAQSNERTTVGWALFLFVNACVVVASFAIQPLQLVLRAMIVDLVPIHQQSQAHAWVAKLNLAGSIVEYSIGSMDLTKRLAWLGNTQIQILCALVSFNLAVCVAITCYFTEEQPIIIQTSRKHRLSLVSCLQNLAITRRVCAAQLFCWFAWFPFMYYMAKYVSSFTRGESFFSDYTLHSLSGETVRTGSFAMLLFAITSLAATIILAYFAKQSDSIISTGKNSRAVSSRLFSLRNLWLAGQIIFFICMMSTFIITSIKSVYILVALTGLPWAVGTWIPFALISQDIQKPCDGVLSAMDDGNYEELAATVVGIHNSAISAPQIAAALGSSLFFYLVGSSAGSDGSEVWLLRFSGVSGLVAAWVIQGLPDTSQIARS